MFKILKNTIKHGYLIMLIVFFLPLKVNANSVTLPQTTLDTIALGNSDLLSSGFSAYGVYQNSSITQSQLANMFATASNNPVIEGVKLYTVDSSQYDVRILTSEEIETFSLIYPNLYTAGGSSVSWDDVFYVTYDNGVFNGHLYVDSNGNILNFSPSNNVLKTAFDLGFGGSVLDLSDITNIYGDIASALNEQQFNYATSDIDLVNNNISLLVSTGYTWQDGRGYCHSYAYLYIPNCYTSPNVKGNSTSNSSYIAYFNDMNVDFTFLNYGWSSNGHNLDSSYYVCNFWTSNTTFKGTTYDKRISFVGLGSNMTTFEDFRSTNTDYGQYYKLADNGFEWNDNIYNAIQNDTIYSFNYVDAVPISINANPYNFDEIANLKDKLDDTNWELNDSFNPAQTITSENYPFVTEDVFPTVIPSDLPFPNTVTDNPDLPLTDNPALEYPQDITQDNADILASFSNLQIPVLSGITKRFPFCIPWDIRDAISLLQYSPTAPAWNFDWKITALGTTYTYNFEGDLSDFDSLATIFRRLMLLAVILGLAFWSYKIFF